MPNRAVGVVMLADISGFSQLMQLLTEEHGGRQGVELLIEMINPVYEMLIDTLHRYRGSVIGFAGDSITCWLDGQDGNAEARGVACALKMQKGMVSFQDMVIPGGTAVSLSVKIALAAGPVRRFLVGNPEIHLQDVLAGETLERMAMAEQIAAATELLVDNHIATTLGDKIEVAEWRESFGIVSAIKQTVDELPWPQLPRVGADLRPFVSRIVRIRLQADESFLGDLRVVSPLFLKFSGIDYDSDEAAEEQLDAFIRWVQGIVTQYGGMLHELTIGDKGSYLYINFGALQAHEDDGKRAVTAAYDLCQIPAELNFIDGVQIGVTRGVAYTGVCGTAERRAFVVMGPAVNEAARIMQMVSIGTVGCNIAAYEAAKSAYDFVSLSPVRTKSRKKWIPVFQPVAQKQGQTMIGEAQFMVGRAFAVEKLNSFLAQIASSQPHLLFIEGEAGIGKSMLVSTLVVLLKERGWACLVGAGQSIGRQTPYLAWQDVFNHYFGLFGISDNELRQQRVQTRFVQMLPEEVIWLPLLNDILNLSLAETNETASLPVEVRQQKLSDLLVGLLHQWSLNEPLIIVLEDVHWLDLLSWELTMQVTHHFLDEALPFGLCAVTRPIDEKELGYRYWQQLRGDDTLKTIIPLTPLEHQTIAQLMAQKLDVLVKDVPSQLVSLVQTRAEGNPLFTEELVFALLEQRVVRVENGRCHIRGDLAQIQQTLPDSLHSLILSRLDRLSLEQQFILKVASVIGRAFAFAPLNALLNEYQAIDEDKLQEILHALETANFAYVEELEPQLIYHFKHIITQEATYQTLHFQQRRQLHASAARWYESQLDNLGGEIYVPLLVHHYHHAKEPTKEGKYAQLAGEQSASRFANQDAISYFTRALALVSPDDLESIYELYKRREMVYSLLGQRQEQREDLSVLMDLAKEWGDVERITAVYLRQAHYFEAITEYEQALSCLQKVITSAEHVQDKELAAEGYLLHGQIQWRMKEYVDACTTLEKAVALADEVQNVKLRSDAIRFIGATYMYRRNIPTAQLYFQQSLALCRELD
ncbi:MAG: AAA family ATPase, partial [Chloroflexi bacterium]|nr:AAA family ATPase [Chloroflexota bacterium]